MNGCDIKLFNVVTRRLTKMHGDRYCAVDSTNELISLLTRIERVWVEMPKVEKTRTKSERD